MCLTENTEDHKFSRTNGRNANQEYEAAVVNIVLRHRGVVTPHEKRVIPLAALKRTGLPEAGQEAFNGRGQRRPECRPIGLEHGPLRTVVERLLDEDRQTAVLSTGMK
jgi:hypothetical protein